jgi:shikimate kinase
MKKNKANIFLIGMMGSGKSSTGSILAQMLDRRFIDLDKEIEENGGKSITDIFREDGEERFRNMETNTARQLDLSEPAVIATGGGFPLREENLQWMKENGNIIWLKAGSRQILERIRNENRPLLPKPVTEEMIETILMKRIYVYEQADCHIDTENRSPQQIAEEIGRTQNV